MKDIVQAIRKLPDLVSLKGVSESEISDAEDALNLTFSSDYRDYLSEFGAASGHGHEYTGICKSSRLSVVHVTISEREKNPDIPFDWYVIEQANIDGIVIWQNKQGEVFQMQSYQNPVKIADSLVDYVSLSQ